VTTILDVFVRTAMVPTFGVLLTLLYPTLKSARPGQNTFDVLLESIPLLCVPLLPFIVALLLNSALHTTQLLVWPSHCLWLQR